ncbi:MAG: RNase adapter RapZ [Coriobacteriia bacterium]|nr:RNase adapter RapZ [Coriobacteriia bacterium]
MSEPSLVVITGLSGAGRTEAMRAFEDMGYFCIDNLPPSLLMNLVMLAGLSGPARRRLAVVCDIRAQEFFYELNTELERIREVGVKVSVLFLETSNEVLLSRYKSTRRRHPLSGDAMTISAAIKLERELLASVREIADFIIDTSNTDIRELRRRIYQAFSQASEQEAMAVTIYSFGFKYGIPMESDLVMDVRFLPNPFYNPDYRDLTGQDDSVRTFVLESGQTQSFLNNWFGLLNVVMPGYLAEGKQHLLMSIGCTGGQHRSVVIAERTAAYLAELGYRVSILHRDLPLALAEGSDG